MEIKENQCIICSSQTSLISLHENMICQKCLQNGVIGLIRPWKITLSSLCKRYADHCLNSLSSDDPEEVHQARVTGRKIRAILEFLGVPKSHWFLLTIKKIHHLLNKVREADVMLLEMQREGDNNIVFAEMERLFRKKRKKLQNMLASEIPIILDSNYFQQIDFFVNQELFSYVMTFNAEKALAEYETVFSQRVEEYHSSVEQEGKMAPASIKALHSVRIQSKSLRYIYFYLNEMTEGDYESKTAFYKNLQNHFGEINDVQDWLHQIQKYEKKLHALKSDIDEVKKQLQTRLQKLVNAVDLSDVYLSLQKIKADSEIS